jgi:hypothetical protein
MMIPVSPALMIWKLSVMQMAPRIIAAHPVSVAMGSTRTIIRIGLLDSMEGYTFTLRDSVRLALDYRVWIWGLALLLTVMMAVSFLCLSFLFLSLPFPYSSSSIFPFLLYSYLSGRERGRLLALAVWGTRV